MVECRECQQGGVIERLLDAELRQHSAWLTLYQQAAGGELAQAGTLVRIVPHRLLMVMVVLVRQGGTR